MYQCRSTSITMLSTIFFALLSLAACSPFGAYRPYASDPYSMGGMGLGSSLGMGSPYGMMGSPYGMGGLGMGGYGMSGMGMGGIPPAMPPPGMGGLGGLGMGGFGSPYSSMGSFGSPLGMSPFFKK